MVEAVRLVIWDLDETFWTGTLTEGGITQYNQVSHDAVIELAHRGIMSSICSKNSHEDIQAILEEHDLWRYFVFPSIAWTPKGKRLEDIVAATQLRAETIIFIDDNPANRAEAEQCVPGIQIADETLVGRILDDPRFRGKGDPGLTRLAQYKMLESRNVDAILRGTDNKAFLRRSDIRVIIEPDVASHIDRAVELVNRTNQLNFTKRRLPEDIEAARAMLVGEITPFWARSGLVRVIDRYGDHGFCGFFVLLADEQRTATDKPAGLLVHFCFSCRILGIGVESWLFQRLGRPRIQIMGEVLTDLWDEHLVDWVRLVDSASEQASSAPKATNVPMIRLRGGCDQNAIAHYFDVAGSDVRLETNFHRNAQIIRFDKSTMLLPSLELHDAAFQDAITALGYTDADLASDFLGSCPEGTLLLYSAPADAWRQVYIHKELRRVVSFDVPELYVNLTVDDPGAMDTWLDKVKPNPHVQHDVETSIAYLRRHFEPWYVDDEQLTSFYRKIFAHVPPGARLVVILPTEFQLTENGLQSLQVNADYNRLVEKAVVGFPWTGLVYVDKCIMHQTERLDASVHFNRSVYHRLFNAVMTSYHSFPARAVHGS